MPREMTHVMGDHKSRTIEASRPREVSAHVLVESNGGTHDVEIIEDIASHGGVGGRATVVGRSLFHRGANLPDSATPHPTGPEGQLPVKTVVQFFPCALLDQFRNTCPHPPGKGICLRPDIQIFHGAFQQVARCARSFDFFDDTHSSKLVNLV